MTHLLPAPALPPLPPLPPADTQRELWMTPYVLWFLDHAGQTERAKPLTEDIVRALDGRDTKDGCIRMTAPTFLLYILDSVNPGGRERVLVWHGPSDGGAFFDKSILQKASLFGVGLT